MVKKKTDYECPETYIVAGAYAGCQLLLAESDIRHYERGNDITVDPYLDDGTVDLSMYIEFTSPWEEEGE